MPTVLDEIRDKKTQAKNRRDLEKFDRAKFILEDAIKLALENLSNPELQNQLAEQLSDCYGLLGGVYRRMAMAEQDKWKLSLSESIKAYDEAYKYESGNYGIVNSYGLVNRLVSRLMLVPASFDVNEVTNFGEGVAPLAMRVELEAAATELKEQLAGPRKGDCWAAADLALLNLLQKKSLPQAYARFWELSPPDYSYKSVIDVLQPLAALSWPLSKDLRIAIASLQEHATAVV